MRPVCRVLLAVCAAGVAAVGPAAVAQAAGSGSITTGPSAEAWYRSSPVCTLPTGCPPGASPYSPETLHVGVALGAEESRTVLQLDLTGLPAGTKPAGGQLRLPIATGPEDGSRAPETARIQACPVYDTVDDDADGSYEGAPEPDCATASVDAVYVAATEQAPAAFTLDLGPLAAVWQESASPGALTLLPAQDVAPTDSWHVAVSTREREVEGAAPITASITFVSAAVDPAADPPPFVPAPVEPGFSAPSTSFAPSDDGFLTPPSLDAPLAAGPLAAPIEDAPAPQTAPTTVVPVASFVDASFRYPAVFLLPLLFAAAVGWLGRALTRDLTES